MDGVLVDFVKGAVEQINNSDCEMQPTRDERLYHWRRDKKGK